MRSFQEAFWSAYSFDSVMSRHFYRNDLSEGEPYAISVNEILPLIMGSGSFRGEIIKNEYVYYKGNLLLASAFKKDGSFELTDDAVENLTKYQLHKKNVEYHGTDRYINPEPTFELSMSGDAARQLYKHTDGISLFYINAPANDKVYDGYHHHEHTFENKEKDVSWKSSVFFAPAKESKIQQDDVSMFEKSIAAVKDIPENFSEALQYFIASSHRTQEDIALSAGISPRNLSRFLNNEDHQPKLETIIALCISLHLYPIYSYLLINKAGYSIRHNKTGCAYKILINTFYEADIDSCNILLNAMGIPPLT